MHSGTFGGVVKITTDDGVVGQFADQYAPAGYAPFNVQNIAGHVFVTYAKQNATRNGVDSGRAVRAAGAHGVVPDPHGAGLRAFARLGKHAVAER